MDTERRKMELVRILAAKGRYTIRELACAFDVSERAIIVDAAKRTIYTENRTERNLFQIWAFVRLKNVRMPFLKDWIVESGRRRYNKKKALSEREPERF